MGAGIWDTVQQTAGKKKFPSWPKPFNAIERINVLNCNEVMMMRFQFVAEIFGEFAFDAFVPSPFELFRNWVFGQLRCGSKMGIRPHIPGPANLSVFKNGKVMIAEIGGGVGGALFFWSVIQSYHNALNTWSTLRNVQSFCEEPEAHGIMRDGEALFKNPTIGGVTGYDLVYDPFNVANPLTGFFLPASHPTVAWAFGTVINESPTVTATIDIWIENFQTSPNKQRLVLGPLQTGSFSVSNYSFTPDVTEVRCENFTFIPGVIPFLRVHATRFMASWGNPEDPNFGMIGGPWNQGPSNSCSARFADGTPIPPQP